MLLWGDYVIQRGNIFDNSTTLDVDNMSLIRSKIDFAVLACPINVDTRIIYILWKKQGSAGINPRADAVGNYVNLADNINLLQLTFTQVSADPNGVNILRNDIGRRPAPAWGSIPTLHNNAGFTG